MDCYTHSTYAYNHAKISFGKDYIPDWWKNTPQKCPVSGKSTIKNCRAFSEYHNSGIVVPLWGELEIEISSIKENTYKWEFSNKDIDVQQHLTDQWDGFSQGKRHNFKLISPWAIKMREAIRFSYSQPIWSQKEFFEHFTILPGVLEFKYQSSVELNYIVCPKKEKVVFRIPALTPMVMMHPMTERKIQIRHHLMNKEDLSVLHHGGGMVFRDNNNMASFYKSRKIFWDKADKINSAPLTKKAR